MDWEMSTIDAVRVASVDGAEERRRYYAENGYVVLPGLIDGDLCEKAMASFRSEVKPFSGYLYRQASANPERNAFDSAGSVSNSLLNPLSVDGRRFPAFRSMSDEILSQGSLFDAVSELYAESAVLVQSMYFEGNPATWPHQDCYYLDDDSPGKLVGAWIALEDIEEAAGRFYVAAGSHRLDFGKNAGSLCIAEHHDAYKGLMSSIIESEALPLHAPPLRQGDVLLWNSRTIHGAFEPSDTRLTRNSYTAHFIPASSRFIQYQCIPIKFSPELLEGQAVCRPKDQSRAMNRWMLTLESRLPGLVPKLKKRVISWKIRRLQSADS